MKARLFFLSILESAIHALLFSKAWINRDPMCCAATVTAPVELEYHVVLNVLLDVDGCPITSMSFSANCTNSRETASQWQEALLSLADVFCFIRYKDWCRLLE